MKITKRQLRRIIKEAMADEPIQQIPGDHFSRKSDYSKKTVGKSYSDVIVMSPAGDSVLVMGMEVDPSSISYELQVASGQKMPMSVAEKLRSELDRQLRSGYVEMPISWSPNTGWRF